MSSAGRILALCLLATAPSACKGSATSTTSAAIHAYEDRQPIGFYRTVFDEFRSLSRANLQGSGMAWKATATAMLAYFHEKDPTLEMTEASYVKLLTWRYGFVTPTRVANWPAGTAPPTFTRPLGVVAGTFSMRLPRAEIEIANHGCATCHAAVLYDATGKPTREAWIGLPSSSINLARYADEAYAALKRASDDSELFVQDLRAVFPGASQLESGTLRKYYLAALNERMGTLASTLKAFVPYSHGGAGLTNGVAAMKVTLGLLDEDKQAPGEVAFTSIPDLGGLRWRSSLFWDGVFAPPGWAPTGPLPKTLTPAQHHEGLGAVAALVTLGTLGLTPGIAADNVPRVREAVAWTAEGYEPPPFPGAVDQTLAARGAAVFERHCTRCHGTYGENGGALRLASFPNHVSAAGAIGTDPARAQALGDDPGELFAGTALGRHVSAKATGGYVAVPLTALWATAPYLHNGSVPTLWHLMHPEARPARFTVGGHRLDFEKLGIDGQPGPDGVYQYPKSYQPWSMPEIYDTRTPGRGNGGHSEPFSDLPEDDKRALVEFLKRV